MTHGPHHREDEAIPAVDARNKEDSDLESMIALIVPVLREHGIERAGVYGSRVRGDAREDSDLDVVVEPRDGTSLLDLVDLQLELQDLLGLEVDVATYNGLHPRLRDRILGEERRIL